MLTSADDPHLTLVVGRLRAAGCVFAEDEAALLAGAAGSPQELDAMAARRAGGLPLEHVLGWAEFCGLRVSVDPGVFVPRRRTEFLVLRAAGYVRPGAVLVDLACGCGAIGLAVAAIASAGDVELYAADIDPVAVACARRNLEPAGGHVYQGDLFSALPDRLRGRIGVLVANVPYVPTGAVAFLPPEARLHEPRTALDGGPDGLDVLRRVAAGAAQWLAPGGRVLMETSAEQAPAALAALAAAGLAAGSERDDELGATVLTGAR
jgi:release factor glutamine methyltransferase